MTPRCAGCGRLGSVDRSLRYNPAADRDVVVLRPVAAATWPDDKSRLLCAGCRLKLDQHTTRLAKAGTGWGHLR
jgi:hypothetical protein